MKEKERKKKDRKIERKKERKRKKGFNLFPGDFCCDVGENESLGGVKCSRSGLHVNKSQGRYNAAASTMF